MDKLKNELNKRWIVAPMVGKTLIDQLLNNRGIDESNRDHFLHPDFTRDLHDPFLLPDMRVAITRLKKAILRGEKIGIFADYDADGIPGAAIVKSFLKNLKTESVVYIPSRREGYGLNNIGLDYLIEHGASLIITVDLGIRNIKEAEYLKSKNIDLIITDHHEPGEFLPQALAVINPKRKDSKYPFRELSGGGVAFKLVEAYSKKDEKISLNDLKWLMDLVSITTICDMVPLIDENRVFAKFGLMVLAKTKRPGLLKLYEVTDIDKTKIDTYTVGFQIGPRLNAPGRLDYTTQSFELLISEDPIEAKTLAKKLDQINFTRQTRMEEVLADVEARIEKNKLYTKKIIALRDRSWPSGINGLIAGKITEKYHRPSIIFERGDEFSKGSARSIDNFNMVEALEAVSKLLVNFGGHAKAAGVTIGNDKFDDFYKEILILADQQISADDLMPKIYIDAELDTKEINLKTFKEISLLEPYGLANPKPVFCLRSAILSELKLVGNSGNHLKLKVNGIDAIAFNFGRKFEILKKKAAVDVAFILDNNVWRGVEKIQIKIIDIAF